MKRFDLFLTCALLLSSCIKEDRSICPCHLYVDLTEVDSSAISSVKMAVSDVASCFLVSEVVKEDYASECVLKVPRRRLWFNVYSGDDGLGTQDSGLLIPYGRDCPPVYMYSSLIDADCEKVVKKVKMSKNHCKMTVCLENEKGFEYSMSVKGNVCGYSADGLPLAGEFNYRLKSEEDGGFSVIVPRQQDSSLVLDVEDGDRVLKSFALGEYVNASGYDWKSENLRDIVVTIDYALTKVRVQVKGWDYVYDFDVVI